MSKEKTPFEKTAAALKVMGKKIAAKKNSFRLPALMCVWIAHKSGHAVACDGHVLACLNLNYWGPLSRAEILSELAFYADMQVLHYANGDALISAEKKEEFNFPILKAYLDAYDLETPWPYWSQRDYRTLQAVFPFIKKEESNVEKHNALEDARAQMRGLITFMSLEAIFKEKPKNINKVTMGVNK